MIAAAMQAPNFIGLAESVCDLRRSKEGRTAAMETRASRRSATISSGFFDLKNKVSVFSVLD